MLGLWYPAFGYFESFRLCIGLFEYNFLPNIHFVLNLIDFFKLFWTLFNILIGKCDVISYLRFGLYDAFKMVFHWFDGYMLLSDEYCVEVVGIWNFNMLIAGNLGI